MSKGGKKPGSISSPPFLSNPPKLHPGVSLAGYFSFLFFIFTTPRFDWPCALFSWAGIALLTLASCPNPFRPLVMLARVLPFLCLALVLHALFTPGTILIQTAYLYVTKEGLLTGGWIAQKLALFFYISFAVTASIPALFLFQVTDRLSRLPFLKRGRVRLWIVALFLILRWLRILPGSWKRQVQGAVDGLPKRSDRIRAGLRCIPRILRREMEGIDGWTHLLIRRGYAEGVLILAEKPIAPLRPKDIVILLAILFALTGGWIGRFP